MKCAFCAGPISKSIPNCPACGQAVRTGAAAPPGPPKPAPKPPAGTAPAKPKPKARPQGPKPVDDLVMAALALEERREATQPLARAGAPVPRTEPPRPAKKPSQWPRYAAAGLAVALLGGAFSPPGRAATAGWMARRAAGSVGYATITAQELGAGAGQLALPNGSASAMDEQSHHQVYRFERELPLLNGKQALVAIELSGFQNAPSDIFVRARKLAPDFDVVTELHRRHRYKLTRFTEPAGTGASHPGELACYYQLEDSAESSLGLLVHYDPARSEGLATQAVLDHVLGSVQE